MQLVASLILSLWLCGCKAQPMAETLDIGKELDEEMFASEQANDEGVPFTRYTAKEGFFIAKVIQNYNFIWQRLSYKQECKNVDVYNSNDKPFLIAIKVIKTDEEQNLFYMNTISTWAPITFKEFIIAKSKNPSYTGQRISILGGSFLTSSVHIGLSISFFYFIYTIAES